MFEFLQRVGNFVVPRLLRSPLHFLISRRLISVTFTGRKSSRRYTTSILYMREGDTLTFFTQRWRTWWKNLQDDAPVTVSLRGKNVTGCASASTDDDAIRERFKRMHPVLARRQSDAFFHEIVMVHIQIIEATEPYALSRS